MSHTPRDWGGWVYFAGIETFQIQIDFGLWERFLNRHPVYGIVELGTGCGGFTHFLALQAYNRGARFVTVDHKDFLPDRPLTELLGLRERFRLLNIFTVEGHAALEREIATLPRPRLVFCDDGDKPREFREFGQLLEPGDYIAVHDWGTEFQPEDVCGQVEMVMGRECEEMDSMTRWFRIKTA